MGNKGNSIEVNENYKHSCNSQKECLVNHISSLSAAYTDEEFKRIIEFYVFAAPILKSDKSDAFGLKNLKDYNWKGNADMNKLERELLRASEMLGFYFIKASTISGTLAQMDLVDRVCVEHPRAVLMQNYSTTVYENGRVVLNNSETRMECLFRHIRNSIAHNHTYIFRNGMILLEDTDQNNIITARIMLKKKALLDWINIVSKQNNVITAQMNTIEESSSKTEAQSA